MALDELEIMIKKQNRQNIIKIKAYSYKINKFRVVTRFLILMEKYSSSLKIAIDHPKMFSLK